MDWKSNVDLRDHGCTPLFGGSRAERRLVVTYPGIANLGVTEPWLNMAVSSYICFRDDDPAVLKPGEEPIVP